MQPSSLVFLAIIAMWAAYLLPQWVRRRDAMGQAPGRDRDSGKLHVLRPRRRSARGRSTRPLLASGKARDGGELDVAIEPELPQSPACRAAVSRPDAAVRPTATGSGVVGGLMAAGSDGSGGATPATGAEAAAFTGPARTVAAAGTVRGRQFVPGIQDDVARAEAARPAGSSSGHGRRGDRDPVPALDPVLVPPGATGARRLPEAGAPPGAARVAANESGKRRSAGESASETPGTPMPPGSTAPPRPTEIGGSPAAVRAAVRAAAIRRARVLAVLLLSTVGSWLGVALSLVQPVVAFAMTALLVADLFALRAVARRREALRGGRQSVSHRSAPAPSDSPETGADGRADIAASRAAASGVRRAASRAAGAPMRRTLPPAAARRLPAHRVSKRETEARETGARETGARETGARDGARGIEATEADCPTSDGTWMPVPVPPPTYTLKPMAPRPEPPELTLADDRLEGPAGPVGLGGVTGGSAAAASAAAASAAAVSAADAGPVVIGSEGIAPLPPVPVPDRYEAVEPPAAQEDPPAKGPWADDDREWADELDLDAVLARRRAVNG